MRKIVTSLIICLITLVNAKAQGIIDSIAIQTCECLENIKNTGDIEEFHMKLGLCFLEKSQPYQEQLKKDYKIDLSKGKANIGKKLGELISMRMVFYCPETILKLAQTEEEGGTTPNTKSKEEFFTIEGKITDIQSEQFLTVKVQTPEGKTYSFLWLYFFDNSLKLMKDKSELVGKNIKISFIEQEFYDAKSKEYRKFKIIKELELD